jgi:hypothetical protein
MPRANWKSKQQESDAPPELVSPMKQKAAHRVRRQLAMIPKSRSAPKKEPVQQPSTMSWPKQLSAPQQPR